MINIGDILLLSQLHHLHVIGELGSEVVPCDEKAKLVRLHLKVVLQGISRHGALLLLYDSVHVSSPDNVLNGLQAAQL